MTSKYKYKLVKVLKKESLAIIPAAGLHSNLVSFLCSAISKIIMHNNFIIQIHKHAS